MKLSRWVLFGATFALGCKASVNAEVKTNARADISGERWAPEQEAVELSTEPVTPTTAEYPESPLLGARRDLQLASGRELVCRCLAARLGNPEADFFRWEASPPRTDPLSQLVFAMESDKGACSEGDPEAHGASYRGYVHDGSDVIILVELGHPKRPVVSGAVIPRPVASGRVAVQPAFSNVPYGRAKDGSSKRCILELPPLPAGATPPPAELASPTRKSDSAEAVKSFEDVAFISESQGYEDTSERRSGFYFGLGSGVSHLRLSSTGTTPGHTYSGLGIPVDIYLGGSPGQGTTIGAVIGGTVYPAPELNSDDGAASDAASQVSDAAFSRFRLAAFFDYYPWATSGLHLLLEAGYSSFFSSNATSGMKGPSVALGLGYDFWIAERWSLGPLARFGYAYASNANLGHDYHGLMPALLVHLVYQ